MPSKVFFFKIKVFRKHDKTQILFGVGSNRNGALPQANTKLMYATKFIKLQTNIRGRIIDVCSNENSFILTGIFNTISLLKTIRTFWNILFRASIDGWWLW